MKGARSAVMPRVEGRKQRQHLGPSALPQHDTVGAHAQGFTQQSFEGHVTVPLGVRTSGFEGDPVWVGEPQLCDVFDGDDAVARWGETHEGRKHGGLAGACATGDEEVASFIHCRDEDPGHPIIAQPACVEFGKTEWACSGHADRDSSTVRTDRWQHGMRADAPAKVHVRVRVQLIEVAPSGSDQRNGERADGFGFRVPPANFLSAALQVDEEPANPA